MSTGMSRDCTDLIHESGLWNDVQSLDMQGIPYNMNFDKSNFGGFSEALQSYAISQLDPFHDTPYRLEGAPSDAQSDSVVLVLNQEKMVDASTFGLPTTEGSKWDLHVAILPLLQQAGFYQAKLLESLSLEAAGAGAESDITELFPITAYGVPTGNKTFSHYSGDTDPVGISPNLSGFFSNTSSTIFIPRTIRCIGVSFEVVDETPKMYQQGSVTVYCKPSSVVDNFRISAHYRYQSAVRSQSVALRQVACPPNDIKSATIIPNSKTWKSQEGAYVVGRVTSSDNPFKRCSTNDLVMYSPIDPDDANLYNNFLPGEVLRQLILPGVTTNSDSFNSFIPFNISGAYFTGVSSQYGTFRIRSKFIYEILPDPTDSSLIPLATPTLHRDPDFERLLFQTISMMPSGVPQTWNPKGELWKTVLNVAKKAARYIKPSMGIVSQIAAGQYEQSAVDIGKLAAKIIKENRPPPKKGKSGNKQTAKQTPKAAAKQA